jgi:ABC-2 type transport system permease protein
MRLLRAELLRFWTRRMVLIVVPIMIVLSVAIAVPMGLTSYPVSAAERVQAQVDLNKDLTEWTATCATSGTKDCATMKPALQDYLRTPSTVADAMQTTSVLKVTLISLLCLLIGASFVAAEFRSGTMSTWLTFNPDRNMVYLAKLAAASLSTGAVTAFAAATSVLTLAITVSVGGVAFQVPGISELIGWNAVGGATFTAVAVAIGMITRHTAAGLGVGIGVNFLEGLVSVLLMLVPSAAWLGPYLPGTQLSALFANGSTYALPTMDATGAMAPIQISAAQGGLYWLIVAVGINALGMLNFARREVR